MGGVTMVKSKPVARKRVAVKPAAAKAKVVVAEEAMREIWHAALPVVDAPAPPADAVAFERTVAAFKARFPHLWEAIRLCPTQHGVEEIAERLKGA